MTQVNRVYADLIPFLNFTQFAKQKKYYFCPKIYAMATYQIKINDGMLAGKNLITFLQSLPEVVTFEKHKAKPAPKSELYHSLDSAFHDVRLMIDGKKREKPATELLYELQNGL
jgi:hypothetical protein